MLKIESLLSFAAVVKHGGITAAAEVKGQTPMAVSKQISNLELQLGEALFERTQKRLVLTEFGRQFEQEIGSLVSQHQALEDWVTDRDGKIQGPIRLVAQTPEVITDTLLPWVKEFMDLYPEIELELDIKKGRISLPDDHYDVYWAVADYLGELHPGLKRRFLWSGDYGIFASPEYLKNSPPLTEVAHLADHQIVGYLHNEPPNVLLTQDPEHKDKFAYHLLSSRIRTVTGMVDFAKQGLGLINGPEEQPDIQKALEESELVPVLKSHWWSSAEAYVYFHDTKPVAPKIRVFLDFFLSKVPEWR